MGGSISLCTSFFEAIWQHRKKPGLVTFACPFPLPSKGLLMVMSETEDMLISTDCRFISSELLNRVAQPQLSNLTWPGHIGMSCGSLHYLLWIKTRKLLSLQTPRDITQTLQKKEWGWRKSSLGSCEWSVCACVSSYAGSKKWELRHSFVVSVLETVPHTFYFSWDLKYSTE